MTDSYHPATGGHAAAMDRMYRHTRHVYDLTRKHYLLGRDRMIESLDVPPGGTVLELGCGTGRNLIAVAARYPDCRVYGVDISGEMLRTAGAGVAAAGLQGRIRMAVGDATAFKAKRVFGLGAFDRVYFSYSLSMIPDWTAALAQGARLTAPDGRLAVVDFGDAARLPRPLRAALHGWLGLFHVEPRIGMEAALMRLAAESGKRVTFERPWRGYAQMGFVG